MGHKLLETDRELWSYMKRKWRGPNAARLTSFSEQMESSGEWSTVANSGVMMMQSGSWSGKVSHVSRQNMLGIVLHVTTEAFGSMLDKEIIQLFH